MAEHNNLGSEGETIAANYLTNLGFDILERNWRYGKYEIDIIAQNNDILVIVEVKSRSTETWEHPKDAITNSKIRFLMNATEAYITQNALELEVRFDVIATIKKEDKWDIEHVENAFTSPVYTR